MFANIQRNGSAFTRYDKIIFNIDEIIIDKMLLYYSTYITKMKIEGDKSIEIKSLLNHFNKTWMFIISVPTVEPPTPSFFDSTIHNIFYLL